MSKEYTPIREEYAPGQEQTPSREELFAGAEEFPAPAPEYPPLPRELLESEKAEEKKTRASARRRKKLQKNLAQKAATLAVSTAAVVVLTVEVAGLPMNLPAWLPGQTEPTQWTEEMTAVDPTDSTDSTQAPDSTDGSMDTAVPDTTQESLPPESQVVQVSDLQMDTFEEVMALWDAYQQYRYIYEEGDLLCLEDLVPTYGEIAHMADGWWNTQIWTDYDAATGEYANALWSSYDATGTLLCQKINGMILVPDLYVESFAEATALWERYEHYAWEIWDGDGAVIGGHIYFTKGLDDPSYVNIHRYDDNTWYVNVYKNGTQVATGYREDGTIESRRVTAAFNENGYPSQEYATYYNPDGTMDFEVHTTYVYGDNGYPVQEHSTFYNPDGSLDFEIITSYATNETPAQKHWIGYFTDGSVAYETVETYDENGNIISHEEIR